ncbi:hypothetical protein CROQUDRAFT_294727 [Cronartium quercuum f. sp. fusiforme G11]|uniref:Uncharacterized protein n=1 Tax=Cronartium quercuum f. sp. fusiforme G11 TaxID=708437 RepID=A0A9P6N7N1_9BASI|nr:hypothetical protein CROQUDRAFT_294727 [Cronartium quercuum f. sp. fusiforme G11]
MKKLGKQERLRMASLVQKNENQMDTEDSSMPTSHSKSGLSTPSYENQIDRRKKKKNLSGIKRSKRDDMKSEFHHLQLYQHINELHKLEFYTSKYHLMSSYYSIRKQTAQKEASKSLRISIMLLI